MIVTREIGGKEYAFSVEHFPDRKRPLLCVKLGDGRLEKVGEITNEGLFELCLQMIFHDAKTGER